MSKTLKNERNKSVTSVKDMNTKTDVTLPKSELCKSQWNHISTTKP